MIKVFSVIFFMFNSFLMALEEAPTPLKIIERKIASYGKANGSPGIAIALVIDGKTYYLNFGLANKENSTKVTEDTLFEIGSITKLFTATILAEEVIKGRMDLNDPVARFMPAFRSKGAAINQVTLKQLATHTSSLPRITPKTKTLESVSKYTITNFLDTWVPSNPIGTHYDYSNLGYALLGIVLENVEKKPYQKLLESDILGPLQMVSTMLQVPQQMMINFALGYSAKGTDLMGLPTRNVTHGAGSLKSTSRDMAQFLLANLGVIGPEGLQKAMKFTQFPQFKVNDKLTMGLGWQRVNLNNLLIIDKNGGVPGFSSYIGFLPEHKIGIVILVNKSDAGVTRLGRQLLEQLSTKVSNIHHRGTEPQRNSL